MHNLLKISAMLKKKKKKATFNTATSQDQSFKYVSTKIYIL